MSTNDDTSRDADDHQVEDEKFDPSQSLPNRRHEVFAQQLAFGKSIAEAYRSAGYQPSRSNAHRLSANENVAARVEFLKREADEDAKVVKTITRDWVLARLAENARAALAESKGGAAQRAAANRALELLGKEVAGMFVERHDVRVQAGVEAVLQEVRPHMSVGAYAELIDAIAIASGIEAASVAGVDSEAAGDDQGPAVH